jgi:hypothetical protein
LRLRAHISREEIPDPTRYVLRPIAHPMRGVVNTVTDRADHTTHNVEEPHQAPAF